jgi:hypothetical protein
MKVLDNVISVAEEYAVARTHWLKARNHEQKNCAEEQLRIAETRLFNAYSEAVKAINHGDRTLADALLGKVWGPLAGTYVDGIYVCAQAYNGSPPRITVLWVDPHSGTRT